MWVLTNGVLANTKTANWFVRFVSDINPTKFATEGILRRFTGQIQSFSINN